MTSDEDLREAIINGYLAQTGDWAGDNHWAWEVITTLVSKAPTLGWPILRDLVERAPDDALAEIGAGPLEDLIAFHGFQTIGSSRRRRAARPGSGSRLLASGEMGPRSRSGSACSPSWATKPARPSKGRRRPAR